MGDFGHFLEKLGLSSCINTHLSFQKEKPIDGILALNEYSKKYLEWTV